MAQKRIIVIGGGITGLSAAWNLQKRRKEGAPINVTLLEGSERLGGVIHSERRDGVLLEHGPDSMVTIRPQGLAACSELGLTDRIVGTNPNQRRSFVAYRGRLSPLPEGIYLLAPSSMLSLAYADIFSWPGKLRMGLDLILPRRRRQGDISLAAFVRSRLGRQALERLAQPMVGGIYGADPRRLSLQATFPQFLEMERSHGSIIRALALRRLARAAGGEAKASGARYSIFVSMKEGLQEITDGMAAQLPRQSVRIRTAATAVQRDGDAWRVLLSDGRKLKADGVVLATPSWAAAPLLSEAAPPLAAMLGRIEHSASNVVNLVYRRCDVLHPLNGMGVVVPAIERYEITACSFSSVKYPGRTPEDLTLLRVFMGGALRPHLKDLPDETLLALAERDVRRLLRTVAPPQWHTIARHRHSLPLYEVGHVDFIARVREAERELPRLVLAGNYFDGVGLPDCIRHGEESAGRVLESVGIKATEDATPVAAQEASKA